VLLECGLHLNKAPLPAHLTVFSLGDKQQKEIHEARQSGSFYVRDGICLRATAVVGRKANLKAGGRLGARLEDER
jgi:hypothetical protein